MSGARARTSRAARNGDSALHRLVRGAVKHADAIEHPEDRDARKPDWHERFMRTAEELREAALDFARSLSKADRERLGR